MAIEFEVETGLKSATATSYASVADFKQYWLNHGATFSDSDDTIKAWLNEATEYIDGSYQFEGTPSTNTQALEWPRVGVTDRREYPVDYSTIPKNLINSTCWLAAQVKSGSLNITNEGIKSETWGPVSKVYSKNSSSREYPIVNKLLRYYLISSGKFMRMA